ncbi:unnamed protein product [Lepeophtheirus salmonis]|uniref:(salmon louse) hypothetical protein n=1 Tax=Lepeophtheirus salmonis TaxID=72036 RepID=A0A7R8GZK6_LEPSM|nr:unnamed protein product [Lepeophtheirus salmonis]CAF2767794.1 unnamed protein product [Lepeophtheirus salmonis]
MLFLLFVLAQLLHSSSAGFVGSLTDHVHKYDISGDIHILDGKTLQIRGFNYNGQGPDAFFYVGKWGDPGSNYGVKINYPTPNSESRLGAFSNEDILLKMPQGVETWDLKWISVWCREYSVDFASARIGEGNPTPSSNEVKVEDPLSSVDSLDDPILEANNLIDDVSEKNSISSSISSLFSLIWLFLRFFI